jgi:hypothetical protein
MLNDNQSYTSDWIHKLENPYHWNLYRHQLDLIFNKSIIPKDGKIIEVGIGSALVSRYLKKTGLNVTTVDIDEDKNPDIVADISVFSFPQVDLLLAFEIFEHIPFETAKSVWENIARQKIPQVAFSLPYAYKTYFWMDYWIPFLGYKQFHIGRKRGKITQEHHYWELGYENKTSSVVEEEWQKLGYRKEVSYRYRNHHFFLMTNQNYQSH